MFISVVQRNGAYFAVRSYQFKALMKIEGTNLEEAKAAITKILTTPNNASPVTPMRPEHCASPETAVKWGSEIAERLQGASIQPTPLKFRFKPVKNGKCGVSSENEK